MSLLPTRRGFLGFLAAPAVVCAANLMPVRSLARFVDPDGFDANYWNADWFDPDPAAHSHFFLMMGDEGALDVAVKIVDRPRQLFNMITTDLASLPPDTRG